MVSVFDVAKYILKKLGSISSYKLHKLVYYSQVWSLVWDDSILFEETIYAWANGPACWDLYEAHRGRFQINGDCLKSGDIANLTKIQIETIDVIINHYGKFSGQQLSDMTHQESPWINARKGLDIGERGDKEIELSAIVEYYSAIYSEQEKKANGIS